MCWINCSRLSIHNAIILTRIICRPVLHLWYEPWNLTAANRDSSVGLVTRLGVALVTKNASTPGMGKRLLQSVRTGPGANTASLSVGNGEYYLTGKADRLMWEVKYNFHILNLGTIWRWMVNFFNLGGPPPPKYPLNRRLGGPQSLCGRSKGRKRLWTVLNLTLIPALSSHLYTGLRSKPAVCTLYLCWRRIVILLVLSWKGKQSSMSVSVRHFQFLKKFLWQWTLMPLTASPA